MTQEPEVPKVEITISLYDVSVYDMNDDIEGLGPVWEQTLSLSLPVPEGVKPFVDIKVIVTGVDKRYEVDAQD